jgi:hypothetical protein
LGVGLLLFWFAISCGGEGFLLHKHFDFAGLWVWGMLTVYGCGKETRLCVIRFSHWLRNLN